MISKIVQDFNFLGREPKLFSVVDYPPLPEVNFEVRPGDLMTAESIEATFRRSTARILASSSSVRKGFVR